VTSNSYIDGETLIHAFEAWAPQTLAEKWDKVGLQVGTLKREMKKVMITLDVLESVVDEAILEGVDFIFAHHPLIFHPVEKMLTDRSQSKIIAKCIKHDIAVYAAHTNLDLANGGMNDWLAEKLGLQNTEILIPTFTEKLFKCAVYVPKTHADQVRDALGNAGAGSIGHYSYCTFNSEGKGTFLPGQGTNPFIGKAGKLEVVDEVKIETIVREEDLATVIKEMLMAHPYEEAAYDIYPLNNSGKTYGLGRIGSLPKKMTLGELAKHVKEVFDLEGVRVVGDLSAEIQKAAVIGGDGNDFINESVSRGADVLITGDTKYHIGHDAMLAGLNIIDAGHNIEKVMKQGVAEFFRSLLKENGIDGTKIIESQVNTNPFTFVF